MVLISTHSAENTYFIKLKYVFFKAERKRINIFCGFRIKKKPTQTNVHFNESFNHTESYALFQFKKNPNLSFKWT